MLLTPLNDSASSLDEARRWFEVATVICKFIPGGEDRASKVLCLFNYCVTGIVIVFKISETYAHLLSRYGNKSTQMPAHAL